MSYFYNGVEMCKCGYLTVAELSVLMRPERTVCVFGNYTLDSTVKLYNYDRKNDTLWVVCK